MTDSDEQNEIKKEVKAAPLNEKQLAIEAMKANIIRLENIRRDNFNKKVSKRRAKAKLASKSRMINRRRGK